MGVRNDSGIGLLIVGARGARIVAGALVFGYRGSDRDGIAAIGPLAGGGEDMVAALQGVEAAGHQRGEEPGTCGLHKTPAVEHRSIPVE